MVHGLDVLQSTGWPRLTDQREMKHQPSGNLCYRVGISCFCDNKRAERQTDLGGLTFISIAAAMSDLRRGFPLKKEMTEWNGSKNKNHADVQNETKLNVTSRQTERSGPNRKRTEQKLILSLTI